MNKILSSFKKYIPQKTFSFLQSTYHYIIVLIAALVYRFPSKKIKVIGVTGTKGKSTTTEIISALLEEAGYKTAVSNTIRHKIDKESIDNKFKMSMPGKFFLQKFIRRAVDAKCDFVILEMTSQGSLQYRHKFIHLNTFVFTNLSPEHIEAHGSYENYLNAKVKIACEMINSKKENRTIIANIDDKESSHFLACKSDKKLTFSIKDLSPFEVKSEGVDFSFSSKIVHSSLSGIFNLYNILAGITCAKSFGVSDEIIIRAIEKFNGVRGRVEKIIAGQDFTAIVDYAHTPDSLEKLYQVFEKSRNICVLGGTGGGRDTWKRKEMGRIADAYCDEIILTNEDPYNEDPMKIIVDVAEGIVNQEPKIILDRRSAIAEAVKNANTGDVLLITGKGTDPYIMGSNGSKEAWDDATVTREEILKKLSSLS
jgi:UDP-N-acetylmuramoyl-L-alanyl-D-glutamate--2,6-diaminopimelate ligase